MFPVQPWADHHGYWSILWLTLHSVTFDSSESFFSLQDSSSSSFSSFESDDGYEECELLGDNNQQDATLASSKSAPDVSKQFSIGPDLEPAALTTSTPIPLLKVTPVDSTDTSSRPANLNVQAGVSQLLFFIFKMILCAVLEMTKMSFYNHRRIAPTEKMACTWQLLKTKSCSWYFHFPVWSKYACRPRSQS